MPVSHLGLTVSHIPSATSFYLAALQPLGYHYVGQQGDSIGLGIKDADFFLCQEQTGARVSPTHIAFAADDRMAVRNCYAAALNAGARPSGAPGYRNDDCKCFNAAVEDKDGNTIEFIFREPCSSEDDRALSGPSGYGQVQKWQDGDTRGAVYDDNQSFASRTSRAKSTAQTALDLASTTSKSMKSAAPQPGITRSRTDPVTSNPNDGGKNIVGTLLGAAAGAAVAYAMCQSERDGARNEAEFARSRVSSRKNSRPRSMYENSVLSGKSHRNSTATPSARTSQRPYRNMLAIDAPSYDDYDVIEQAKSRYTSSRRPELTRRKTYDAIEYPSRSSISDKDDYFGIKRASTLPIDSHDYGGSRTAPTSRHTSRRGSFDDTYLKRHDSGVDVQSYRSRRSSASKASTAKSSRRGSPYDSAANVPLPSSKAQSYISAADKPLPSSRATSYVPASQVTLPSSKAQSYISAADKPLPSSRATSYLSSSQVPVPSSKAQSYISAADKPLPSSRATSYLPASQVTLPPSRTNGGYTDRGEESDGLGDMKTVVPEDSISCIDFSTKSSTKSKASSNKSSRRGSKQSEADSERTVRPAKPSASRHSAQTLPTRPRGDYSRSRNGKRSTATYA